MRASIDARARVVNTDEQKHRRASQNMSIWLQITQDDMSKRLKISNNSAEKTIARLVHALICCGSLPAWAKHCELEDET